MAYMRMIRAMSGMRSMFLVVTLDSPQIHVLILTLCVVKLQ